MGEYMLVSHLKLSVWYPIKQRLFEKVSKIAWYLFSLFYVLCKNMKFIFQLAWLNLHITEWQWTIYMNHGSVHYNHLLKLPPIWWDCHSKAKSSFYLWLCCVGIFNFLIVSVMVSMKMKANVSVSLGSFCRIQR